MLFNSIQFLIFFPIVVVSYFLCPQKYRWLLLLIASCIFYLAFIPWYILILAVTIGIDYYAGRKIEDSVGPQRKAYLIMSIVSTCLVLAIFKYFNFFNTNFAAIAGLFHLNYPIGLVNIILPIGLSFHTFQSLSYVIEVYRGKQKAERHFGIYSLYVMFFPQLVAGPIERPQNLLHQFYEEHVIDLEMIGSGFRLILWGLFKKMMIADQISPFVNEAYGHIGSYSSLSLAIATFLFAFQIYCDFSGYSDIARGTARVMGFRLMNNFRSPYFSKTIGEFWSRWHISLSTWFRDYVYIPSGGNRVSVPRHYFNLMLTFMISGLWHGANWTYVAWGTLHGAYMIIEVSLKKNAGKLFSAIGGTVYKLLIPIQILFTFLLVNIGWIFFRAKSIEDASLIIKKIFHFKLTGANIISLGKYQLALSLVFIIILMIVDWLNNRFGMKNLLLKMPAYARWTIYYSLILIIFSLAIGQPKPQAFIYFQF